MFEAGSRSRLIAWIGCGLAAGALLVVGLFRWFEAGLFDEWVCSQGEAPAGVGGRYNFCFDVNEQLPPKYEWDPLGNRPMAYNCDKRGFRLVEHTMRGESVQECVRDEIGLPRGWRLPQD